MVVVGDRDFIENDAEPSMAWGHGQASEVESRLALSGVA